METDAPRPARGLLLRVFWTLLAVVVIGYPLSIGPLSYWHTLHEVRPASVLVQNYVWPLKWLSINAEWALLPLGWYVGVWDDLAEKHREARLRAAPATPAPAP